MLSVGMGTIATVLSRLGHDVRVIDNNSLYKFYSDRELLKLTREFNPGVVAFSITIVNALVTYRLLEKMKREMPQRFYLAGGMHAPAGWDEMLEYGFDIVVNREGELVVGPLIEHLEGRTRPDFRRDLEKIPGVSFCRENGEIHGAEECPIVENLDDVPYVDYDLFNMRDYFKTGREPSVILVNGQRGCPYRCNFCSNERLRSDKRQASAEYLFGYVEYLHKKYGVRYIWICDNNFLFPKERAEEFCRRMISSGLNRKLDLVAQSKVELAHDEETLALLKKAGFTKIGFGLERLEPYSQKMIQKPTSLERVHEIFSLVKKHGINISINAIFGFPFDTVDLVRKERELFREVLPYCQNIVPNFLTPIHGTPYYDNYPKVRRWYLNPRFMETARTYYAHALDLDMIDTLKINFYDLLPDVIDEVRDAFLEFKKFNHGAHVLKKGPLWKAFSRIDLLVAQLSRLTFKVSPGLEFLLFNRIKFLRYYFATLVFGRKVALPKNAQEE